MYFSQSSMSIRFVSWMLHIQLSNAGYRPDSIAQHRQSSDRVANERHLYCILCFLLFIYVYLQTNTALLRVCSENDTTKINRTKRSQVGCFGDQYLFMLPSKMPMLHICATFEDICLLIMYSYFIDSLFEKGTKTKTRRCWAINSLWLAICVYIC
jgi:hypothetical protein